MAGPARQSPEFQTHSVRWEREDWDRIHQATEVLREREHLNLTPTDIIRSATRRYLDDLLQSATLKVG